MKRNTCTAGSDPLALSWVRRLAGLLLMGLLVGKASAAPVRTSYRSPCLLTVDIALQNLRWPAGIHQDPRDLLYQPLNKLGLSAADLAGQGYLCLWLDEQQKVQGAIGIELTATAAWRLQQDADRVGRVAVIEDGWFFFDKDTNPAQLLTVARHRQPYIPGPGQFIRARLAVGRLLTAVDKTPQELMAAVFTKAGLSLVDAQQVTAFKPLAQGAQILAHLLDSLDELEASVELQSDVIAVELRVIVQPGSELFRFANVQEARSPRNLDYFPEDPVLLAFDDADWSAFDPLPREISDEWLDALPWSVPEVEYLQSMAARIDSVGARGMGLALYRDSSSEPASGLLWLNTTQPDLLAQTILSRQERRWRRSLELQREAERKQGNDSQAILLPERRREVPLAIVDRVAQIADRNGSETADTARLFTTEMDVQGSREWELRLCPGEEAEPCDASTLAQAIITHQPGRMLVAAGPGQATAHALLMRPALTARHAERLEAALLLAKRPWFGLALDIGRAAHIGRGLKPLAGLLTALANDNWFVGAAILASATLPAVPIDSAVELSPISLVGWAEQQALYFRLQAPIVLLNQTAAGR